MAANVQHNKHILGELKAVVGKNIFNIELINSVLRVRETYS